ncbi:POLYCHOME protein [Spatholobus suberectus]|nr:POLYCHOME protein [Spatholobus suberectus]
MPESRDRRVTPLDLAALFARRRASLLHPDPPPRTPPRTASAVAPGRARPHRAPGSENTPPLRTARRGRARVPSRSVLPAWYPRTPLRDITAVVRAIERRRARLGEDQGQQVGNAVSADQAIPEPSEPASSSAKTPKSVGVKLRTPSGSKVPKIYLDFSGLPEGESEALTPQRKLLNSIDEVEEVVLEELKKLEKTPSAKKAVREKRMRTLMSMR